MDSIYQLLVQSAGTYPDKPVIIDEAGGFTYKELLKSVDELAGKLKTEGIGKGSAVGMLTGNNRNFLTCLFAIVATEALAMPISHQQKKQEIAQGIAQAKLGWVVGEADEIKKSVESDKVLLIESLCIAEISQEKELVATFINNPAFMRFTSGTTGLAKGVILSHQSVIERIESANKALNITSSDTVLWVLPMAYHFIVSLVLFVAKGATVVVNYEFLAEGIVKSCNMYHTTFFYGSPTHIKLLATYPGTADLSGLRMIISTTTAISASVCEQFYQKYGLSVTQAFGIIEVGLPIINVSGAHIRPDAVGYALPDYQVSILDDTFNERKVEEIGQLAIKGPGMFDGYLSPETFRTDVLQKGWFITGDLAVMDVNGLITIKGRKKEVINVHGNKVFPNEVEEVINQFEGVQLSRVYGQQHALFGEIVVADIIAIKPVEKEALISFCRKKLSSYKLPQRITEVKEITMTGSGKVKRW